MCGHFFLEASCDVASEINVVRASLGFGFWMLSFVDRELRVHLAVWMTSFDGESYVCESAYFREGGNTRGTQFPLTTVMYFNL